MRSGTVIALVVAFILGIGCTIAFLAWLALAAANASLAIDNEALEDDVVRLEQQLATFSAKHRLLEQELEEASVALGRQERIIQDTEAETAGLKRQLEDVRVKRETDIRTAIANSEQLNLNVATPS